MVALEYDRSLVIAVALVASCEFGKVEFHLFPVIAGHLNQIGGYIIYRTRLLGHHTHAGVNSCLHFHTGSYRRSFRGKKRNGLTLHVGSHQRTVGIVVFQERNQGGSHGEHHLGRYIHVIKHGLGIFLCFFPVTAGYGIPYKMSFRVQGFIRLGNMVIIFLVGCHIYNIFRYPGVRRIGFVYFTVGCFHETVLVNSRITGQGVDQTDIGSFRRLDRAHSSVMGIMYVTYLKSCTITAQTARSQRGKTSLMGKLTQRVILIHELGQLGGTEEFLNGSLYRFDVDQNLRRNLFRIMCGHSFTDHSFHPGQTDTVLVLEQLAHSPDTSVAQMIDIVFVSDAVFQMDIIINGSQDVFLRNMLRYQLMDVLPDSFRQLFRILGIFFQDLCQDRIIYQLGNAQFPGIAVHIMGQINHHAGKHLHIAFLRLDIDERHRTVLDGIRQLCGHFGAGSRQKFPRRGIYHILRQ